MMAAERAAAPPPRPGSLRAGMDMLWALLHPERMTLAAVIVLSLTATTLALVQPFLTKLMIDDGILGGNFRMVVVVALALVAASLFSAGLGAANRWLYVGLSARVLFALREQVFGHLLTLSPRFFARRKIGELMSRLDGDVAEVQRFALDSLLAALSALILLVGSLLFMVALSPLLTAIAFVLLPAQALFLRAIRPRLTRRTQVLRERAAVIGAYFVERLGAVRLIQAHGQEVRERGVLARHQDDYRSDLLALQMTSYLAGAGPGLMMTLSTATVFVAGGALVIGEQLTLGTLIAFSAYLGRATGPVQTFLGLYAASARAEVSLVRVLDLLDEAPEVTAPVYPLTLPPTAAGKLHFDNVTFFHPGRPAPILTGIDLALPAGVKIAIGGVSGAGKSTLTDLLLRHYDPDGGRITLDGVDLRQLALSDLRRRIAVVTQETLLLHASLADNLRFAAPEATDERLCAVLSSAQLDGLLARLPDGLATMLGERGAGLSGGERQRLAIARALLQDPLVIVFDEATSGIDAATEAGIMATVDALFATRTRIVISHHERAFDGAALNLVLSDGCLRVRA